MSKQFKHKKHKRWYTKDKSRKLYPIKVRLYPESDQKLYASKSCGTRRFVYNYLLGYVQEETKRRREIVNSIYENYVFYNEPLPDGFSIKDEYCSVNAKIFNSLINELKHKDEYKWIEETNSKVIQQAINDLIDAFSRFFKKEANYPQFKKKSKSKDSCRFIDQAIQGGTTKYGCSCIEGNRLTINKTFKNVLFRCSRRDERYLNKYQSLIHNITLSKTKTYKYYASILIERVADEKIFDEKKAPV